jgi:hypothetical protein
VYQVTAVAMGSEGIKSARTEAQIDQPAPSSLQARHDADDIRVSWNAPPAVPTASVTAYRLYRRAPWQPDFVLLLRLSADSTSHLDRRCVGMNPCVHRDHDFVYVVSAELTDAVGAVVETSWSVPARSQTPGSESAVLPQNVTSAEGGGGVQVQWDPPSDTTSTVAGYRVFRNCHGAVRVELTAAAPIVASPLLDMSYPANSTCSYAVATVNGAASTATKEAYIEVAEAWDDLWAVHTGMNDPDESFAIVDAVVTVGKHRLRFNLDGLTFEAFTREHGAVAYRYGYRTRELTVETLPEWQTAYRFVAGTVEYRARINVTSSDIRIDDAFLAIAMDVDSLDLDIDYIRPYSVGAFMRDDRAGPGDTLALPFAAAGAPARLASALGAKPVGPTRVEVSRADVKVSLSILGWVALNIALALLYVAIALGIGVLRDWLGPIVTALMNPLTVTIATFVLTILVNVSAVPLIETEIERRVRGGVLDKAPAQLDRGPLMMVAGEGLAESLARKVLADPAVNVTLDAGGRNRYRDQFWQMVVVEPGRAAFWVRR